MYQTGLRKNYSHPGAIYRRSAHVRRIGVPTAHLSMIWSPCRRIVLVVGAAICGHPIRRLFPNAPLAFFAAGVPWVARDGLSIDEWNRYLRSAESAKVPECPNALANLLQILP
jgi:hypothetical protein